MINLVIFFEVLYISATKFRHCTAPMNSGASVKDRRPDRSPEQNQKVYDPCLDGGDMTDNHWP